MIQNRKQKNQSEAECGILYKTAIDRDKEELFPNPLVYLNRYCIVS